MRQSMASELAMAVRSAQREAAAAREEAENLKAEVDRLSASAAEATESEAKLRHALAE